VTLAQQLDKTLKEAEAAVAKVMTADGELKSFDPNNNAK
jgi:exodeoxyribonuclease VII small subunit